MHLAVFPSLHEWTDLCFTFWLWPTSWKPLNNISPIILTWMPVSSHSIFRTCYRSMNSKKRNRVTKTNFIFIFIFLHSKVPPSPDCDPFAPLWEVSAHNLPCTNVFECFLSLQRGVLVLLRGLHNLEIGFRYWRCIHLKTQSITTTFYILHLLERCC